MNKNSRIVNASILLLMAFLFVVFVSDNSEAAEYTVDNMFDADYSNITQAVENASAGDTIRVASRTYYDAVDVDRRLTIAGGNYGVDMNGLYNYCNNYDVIGYYNFDNSGNTYFYDRLWCENNHGDIEGASRTTSSFWGSNALDFDGNNDYGVVDHSSLYNVSEVSISAWINVDDNDTDQRIIFSNYQQPSDSERHGYKILLNSNAKFEFVFGFGSSSGSCGSDAEITEDNWTLVTATYDESSIKLYINDELDATCNYTSSISNSDGKQTFGAGDSTSDDTYDNFFDGTIDEVVIWKKAISSTDVENIFWGGNNQKPRIDASEGGYAIRLTVDDTTLNNFYVRSTGSDIGESSGDAGLIIEGTDGDPISDVSIDNIEAYYNYNGLRVSYANDISINSFSTHGCNSGDDLEFGVTLYHVTSSEVRYGNAQCTDKVGYYITEGSNNNIFTQVQTYSSAEVGFKVNSNGNYFNYSRAHNNEVGLLFYGGDNNELNYGWFEGNEYGIGFTRGAENNQLLEPNFDDNDDSDIHHGYQSNSTRNGWNNILIDVDFDELSIDSNSRLLEKTLVETTITDNGTYAWNRVNTTLDSNRRAYADSTNSFWAGISEDDEYAGYWNVTFKMESDVTLPSGGIEQSSILEIKTWYKTENGFDGGRVYITDDEGSSWNLLTPSGGYDRLMNDGSMCDNNEKAFTGDKSDSGWQNKRFNLSGYRGDDIRIKFVFCSDSGTEMEGWYIDNVKIYKDADPSSVLYFDDFERLGHKWVDPRGWVHEGNPEYGGKKDADIIIIEGTSSEILLNTSINKDMLIHLKMDESGTSSAYDSVMGQYWYRYGNTNYVSGLYDNAANYDGSGDYHQTSYDYISTTPYRFDKITISSWVKFDAFPSSSTDYDTVVATDREGQFRLQVNSSGNPIAYGNFYGTPSGEQRAISDDALVTGVWYHLAGTWSEDTDSLKLYINGTLVKTNSFSGTTAYLRNYGSYMYVGRDYNGHYMDGTVDNVQIWTDDFNAREIKAIYDNPVIGPVLYKTEHYGGSNSKTDNDGQLDDIYVTTKIYDGSSSGSNVDTYIGIRYSDWTREIAKITITDNKLEAKVFDFRVYNRNKDNLYYSLSSAVSGASSGNVLELWPGTYKENVEVTTKIAIVGAGTTRTILDGRYRGPAIKFYNTNSDYSSVKNLRVTHSANQSSTCQSGTGYGGAIYSMYSDFLTIDNVHFFETYIGFMSCYSYDNKILNSEFDRGSISSNYAGIYIYGGYNYEIKNNEITKYNYGIYIYYDTYGSLYYNNSIHNNTNYGIYMQNSGSSSYSSDPLIFEKNSFVDNSYGFYRGDTSSSYGRYVQFKDNLVKSNSYYGVYCYYYCQDWKVENNTFDGDNDQDYGWYSYRYQYRTEFGNNTFREHTAKDIYMLYCGTGTNANKFFYNTYSSITVSGGCQVDIYNNLNVKVVEEDSDAFSNVEIEIKDSSNTYYETPHWGGSDALTDSNGFISSSMMIRSGYYSSSSSLTDNNITVNLAYGVRAKSTWILFDEDKTESVTVPDVFRFGVVKNTNTSTLYTSFSSAISAASTDNVLHVWAWTYNENIVVNKGVSIIGNSTSTSKINGGTGDYVIEVKSNDVTIKNLTLNGATDSLLYAGNYNNLKVENVIMTASSSNYGIYFDRTSDTTITSVTVNDTDRKSVYITEGDTITFKNSYFMNASSSHGFEISDSEDIILDNVFIYNSGYNGSSSYGLYIVDSDKVTVKGSTKVGSSKSYELYANEATNLKIQNSTFTGKDLALIEGSDGFLIENSVFKDTSSGDYGVYIKNTDDAIFKFNTVLNSASDGGSDFGSIYLTSSSSNSILNNTVTNSGRSGIHLKSSSNDNKIYGNTVSSSYFHGLYIQSSDRALIRNNSFSSSSDYGIKVSSSDTVVIDNNTLSSNSNYGIYASSADNLIIKSNTVSDNNAGIYVTGSDDVVISLNTVDDQTTYGVYLSDSKRLKIKKNIIKNSLSDALVLSSNCDNAFVDNNTIKNNGDTDSGRAVKLYEVDNTVLYNNSIESNDYTGLLLTSSKDNKIIQNIIKGNGKYGIQISNDFIISSNNTIEGNTVNDNEYDGMYIAGIYTKIISNTIKYNEKDGIHILDAGARATIQQNTVVDNEDSAVRVMANYGTVTLNTIDGDTSSPSVVVIEGRSVIITNNTIEGGSQGIKVQNSTNAFVYNNTVKSNSDYGIYFLLESTSADIKYNIVKDNEDVGIYISSSNSADIKGNTIEENNGYGIFAETSKLVDFENNTIEDNDGGVKFSDCDYCNLTLVTIKDNGGRGVWFVDSDNNYIKHVTSKDSSDKDVYFQGSVDNTAFNFTFSTIFVNSSATLTITSNLEIVFQDGSSDPFEGIDFALLTKGVKVYSTPFYGGSDAVSDSNGEAGATFSLDYRIYNGSSTPDNIANIIKYHYGVRSKEKSIDMSTSHTETVSVPSYWVKGLVRNIDTSTDYYKIQDAIDNASAEDILHIWAWTYSENVEVDESITIIGNGTGNTTLNATSSGKGFDITSDDVTIRNIKVENCGDTSGYNAFQVVGDDVTIENVIAETCYRGASVEGSGAWIGNSTFSNNYNQGIEVWVGNSSSTAVKIYKNNIWWNGNHGIKSFEDDIVINSNIINNNSASGIYLDGAADTIIKDNTFANNDDGITVYNGAPRVLIKDNTISNTDKRGIYVSGATANDGVFESNTITDCGLYGIYIVHSDYFYLGNNSVSGSDSYDLRFNKRTEGNSAKNTTFSTILVHEDAYFAIYNDLTLKFMQNATLGFDDLDVKLVSDSSTKYATSYYSGSDSKTNSNGLISTNFTLKFRIYDGTSTPDEATTTLYYHYGVRAKAYNVNMTTSHTETVSVPSYWKDGLVENLNSGLKSASIQDAIDNASSGDVLQLWEWDYVEYGIEVTERVTILGNSSSVTVSGNNQDDIFILKTNSITLKNLTIEESGTNTDDECIDIRDGSDIKIDNVILKDCNIGILVETSNVVISNVTIQDSVKDGIIVKASGVTIENSTIKDNGRNGIELYANTIVYNNTIKENQKDGINITANSNYAKILSNTIEDNDDQGISIYGSHHVTIKNNDVEDNDYGIFLKHANFTQIQNNNIKENDIGGIKFVSTKYSNITSSTFNDNNGKGIWFTTNSDSNNIRDSSASGSSGNDIELDSSEKNTGFNFTFGSGKIDVDSDSDFRVMNSLNIKFVNGSTAFADVELELFNYDTVLYASPFYDGNDGASGSDGFIDNEFTVAYEIYNGSSTTEDVQTFLKYSYGVRGKTIEIDMSTSHTETVDVPSYWTKGLVRNIDTSTDFYKIQDAIDNASAEDTLHIWAWIYYENVVISKELTVIGNGTTNTTINGTFIDNTVKITADKVSLSYLNIEGGGNSTLAYYGIYLNNVEDVTIENIIINFGGSGLYNDGDSSDNIVSKTTIKNQADNGIHLKGSFFKLENSTIEEVGANGIYANQEGDNSVFYNNTISNIYNRGIYIDRASDIKISYNTITDCIGANSEDGAAIWVMGADNTRILHNNLSDNRYGIHTWEVGDSDNNTIVIGNIIKDNDNDGVKLTKNSRNWQFWNNTITDNGDYDIHISSTGSTGNRAVNTDFDTIYVNSGSSLTIRGYFVLDVNDASGENMSGIDIKVMENDVQKYATSYFGGSDSKTDSSGTVATFLINNKIYDGSSTSELIPTYVSARYYDWVETTSFDVSSTIQITVPDLRVYIVGSNDDKPEYYHIQTAIDEAGEGETIRAWNGTYLENIEIDEELTIIGNGTSTIINGGNDTAIDVTEDSVTIKNIMIIYSEKGIYVNSTEDTVVTSIKFTTSEYAVYSEDSQNLIVNNSIFDVDDYGIYLAASSDVSVMDNEFRNGTQTGDYCIYQSESSDNGGANIENNKFNDCNVAWRSGSSSNTFRDNTLKDNEYGVLLSGTEAHQNLLHDNNFDDSVIAVYIYNTAYDNHLYNNFFDSDDYDIKLSDSYDTVSYNNTFSDISVASDANMWIKVYIDVDVTDNSSNAFSNVDLEIKQDNLVVYSTVFYGGSDSRTDINGEITEFLVATSQYNGSSTPTSVTTTVNARYSDWISSDTYNINNEIVIKVDDFRVKNEDSDQMFYSINGAINAASNGDTLLIWTGTYYENVVLNKELTLTGNGTSATIINGSYSGNVITVSADEVEIEYLSVIGSAISGNQYGILVTSGDSTFKNLNFEDNTVGYKSESDFNQITGSTFSNNNIGVSIGASDNNVISDNDFSDNTIGVEIYGPAEDNRIENNEISGSSQIGIYLKAGSDKTEETIIKDNYIHNNSGIGIHIKAHDNEIFNNVLEYNSDVSFLISDSSGNNSIHNNTFKSNDDSPVKIDSSYYNILRDNDFTSSDDYFVLDGGGYNTLDSNTFDDTGILLENSNNQIIKGNTITDAPDDGIRIYKSSSNNYFSDNSISGSDDEDIYVGGAGSQINNRGFNNTFTYIKVQSNGEFVVLDYIGLRTINSEGNMSGNDVKATFGSDTLYASSYFGGNDPVTDSSGLIPNFVAPIEIYDGSSTPTKVITPMTVRFSDWIETFNLDPYSGSSITVTVPDLRVKNNNTGEWSYFIQTSINKAGSGDVIIISPSTYYETIIVNRTGITLQGYSSTELNEGVIIDAENEACAITVQKSGISILGLNITNSFAWEDPFNSSGIRVLSDNNEIKYNRITDSYVGILLETSDNNEIHENEIDNVDIGIIVTKSNDNSIDSNQIIDSDIADIRVTSFGYTSGSENNDFSKNTDIELIEFIDSNSNSLNDQEVGTYDLENSKRISVYQSSYDYVICDSDSSLYLKNWININVSRDDVPLNDVDVKVWDSDNIIYSTDYFGGTNSKTDSQGKVPEDIELTYRVFNGSSTAIDNVTKIKIRVGDWFKTETSETDETRVDIDFDVPVFRIINQDTSVEYNYIQRAIDNASAGDTIFLLSGEYNENIEITEEIILKGNGTSTVISVDAEASASRPAIKVSEDNVVIENLKIIGWNGIIVNNSKDTAISDIKFVVGSYGIFFNNSSDLIVNNSTFDLTNGPGIYLDTGSTDALIRDNTFSNATSVPACLESHENGAQIINNTFDNCGIGWMVWSSNNVFRDNTLKDNEYGVKFYGNESYNNMIRDNTFDDNEYGITILSDAYDNSLFNNVFSDSDNYDIWLQASYDTVSYNNTFSDIIVHMGANMWVKVDFDLIVYDNSSITFLDADVEVKQDDLVVYSSPYFGGSDPKTNSYGTVDTFLINYKEYNDSSTPSIIPTDVTIRSYDWEKTFSSDPSSTISLTVPDLRVQNVETGVLTYYIQTAIDDADEGDTISVWSGTYYENIEINKEIILIGDGTSTIITVDVSDSGLGSPPIVNLSREGINITADNVELRDLIISNFSIGIKIFGADDVYLSNIQIFDVVSDGIQVSGSESIEIMGLHIESSSDGIGISVMSGSDNLVMSDTVITGFENGIFVNTYGVSLDNITAINNDNYGCYVVGTNIEISDSTFTDNGINGIRLNALTSGILDNNIIFDNGNAEVRIISVVNIEMKDNSISDPSDGYGIHVTASSGLDIHDNILNLTIWLDDSDFNTIRNNMFSSINGGSVTYDNVAIIVGGSNNTISNNDIDDVGIAFAFLPGNHNYNAIENNTLGLAGYDIEYYTAGQNNTFINTDIGIVDISEDSYFEIIQFIDIEMLTLTGPADGVDLEILEGDNSIYSTEMYDGSDAKTDTFGKLDRLFIISKIYDGVWVPEYVDTFITYYYDGAEYNEELDTSILQENSHLERIWVNLRPISVITDINGIGDNLQTGVEEAVKGADQILVDQYTIAYWPFDEGSGADVIDSKGDYTGTILPIGIWNDGRPNSTADTSVEFDGTFTNIDTDLTMNKVEFTVEIWFKTDGFQKMTLISDKDNLDEWGYNLYVEEVVRFDFTVDNGEIVGIESSASVRDNEWHFVTIVRGEDYVGMWLDGIYIEKSWSGEIDFTDSKICIGQTPLGGDSFEGLIDDLRFSSITRHKEDFMTGSGIVEFISESYDIDGSVSEHRWSSSLDGPLGDGSTLYYPVKNLSEGSHTIYLSILDDNGTISDVSSSVLVVMQRPDSQILSLKINDNPAAWGWQVQLNNGDLVELSGGTTSEQFISSYIWTSSIDGILYENGQDGISSFSTTLLSNGTHTISFSLRGGNGLWSTEKTFDLEVNGRPEISENAYISEDEISRFRSAMFKVKIIDDITSGDDLNYTVSYRVKGTDEWFEEYIHEVIFNEETEELEFIFTPDENAPVGNYEFSIDVLDELGGLSDPYVLSGSVSVENNDPVIEGSNLDVEEGDEPRTVTEGEVFNLVIDSSDEDGIVSTVIWYADTDGDGEPEEIGSGANYTFENNNLPVGDNLITVRVLDNEGSYVEQTFTVVIEAQPIEESLVAMALEDFSNNLPLIGLLAFGMVMVVGTIALRRNRNTDAVVEGLVVDDGIDPVLAPREPMEVEEWDIPTDAQGNALIIGEYMAKRRESYITHPNNDEVVDYLHNNRERFAISSYFDVPGDPTVVVTDWALPENLRGNVHLDSFRQQIVERITDSSPDKNFVIIGEPGVGKTVMLFEVFDRLMNKAPVGILSTDTIAKAHEMFGVRVFYDDIPENQKLVEALTENDVKGVIVSSREADWKALPTEMQAKFDRLTVPLFSELDMKAMIQKMMSFQSIGFNDDSVKILAEYAEGSPIYVWSMVREMMHRSVKTLTREYIEENSVKGMINYVAQLLQRLLKDGEEYRKGGLHALASLIFLSDHMEERYCNDYFFDAYVEVLSKYTEEKLDDKMNPKTLNLVLAYLPINDSVIRFPHDTWPDVLQGWGDMNPFSTELRMINRAFADSGIFQDLKKEVVADVWNSTYDRYKRTPS
ncbi:right-handed parallel beta-helix repeat-containing protein, partial [Euryarchaeota archaeon]|nr:right-handed parallel beta-helix repeat-containing protein [Euryarchaeota archaeon]